MSVNRLGNLSDACLACKRGDTGCAVLANLVLKVILGQIREEIQVIRVRVFLRGGTALALDSKVVVDCVVIPRSVRKYRSDREVADFLHAFGNVKTSKARAVLERVAFNRFKSDAEVYLIKRYTVIKRASFNQGHTVGKGYFQKLPAALKGSRGDHGNAVGDFHTLQRRAAAEETRRKRGDIVRYVYLFEVFAGSDRAELGYCLGEFELNEVITVLKRRVRKLGHRLSDSVDRILLCGRINQKLCFVLVEQYSVDSAVSAVPLGYLNALKRCVTDEVKAADTFKRRWQFNCLDALARRKRVASDRRQPLGEVYLF